MSLRPAPLALALALTAGLGYGVAWQRQRAGLRLENHLARRVPLALEPRGRPQVAADGQLFLVAGEGADTQLLSVSRDGQPLWNRRLGESVTPQPLLVAAGGGRRVLVVAQGGLLPFTLGGDALPRIAADTLPGDRVAADEDGDLYVLGREGRLARLDAQGNERARLTVGLTQARGLLLLPGERLLLAGARGGGAAEAWLGVRAGGQVALTRRLALAAPPAGLARSGFGDELAGIAAGAEVVTVRGDGAARRLRLPGAAQGAPLLLADGSVYALVTAAEGGGGALVHLDAAGAERGRTPAEVGCGLVRSGDGQILACFRASAPLLPAHQGVLALRPGGGLAYRQGLPAAPLSLALDERGAPVVALRGERALWVMDGGVERERGPLAAE